jgi:hypothetical protein
MRFGAESTRIGWCRGGVNGRLYWESFVGVWGLLIASEGARSHSCPTTLVEVIKPLMLPPFTSLIVPNGPLSLGQVWYNLWHLLFSSTRHLPGGALCR